MTTSSQIEPEEIVRSRFDEAGIRTVSIERRDFPEESIFVVRVDAAQLDEAAIIGNALDRELQRLGFDGFVTVRKGTNDVGSPAPSLSKGVEDSRAHELTSLLTARSRTSEVQPSFLYIPDIVQNISTAMTPRHHLVFGRRGAGKTALLVEAKRQVEQDGHLASWSNIQTLRHESANRCFLWIAKGIIEKMQSVEREAPRLANILSQASKVLADVEAALAPVQTDDAATLKLVPQVQALLSRYLRTVARRLYIFVDELHYLPMRDQPRLLDLLHSICRDSDVWLKIAAIRHLARWYQASPPMGLETGHDADHIELDVTLQNPKHAKAFLEAILKSYAKHTGISSITLLFSPTALDRLVIASGAVPRDYLVLSASAIRQAQRRQKSRVVGVQDVNKAAGEAAKVKIAELEDDAAALEGASQGIANAAQVVRNYCLEEQKFTFFRIDFRDKELHPRFYNLMQSLMDLRVIHLISPSVSDEREAGRRSEVLMLDLAHYSSQRLKKHLQALDFESGNLVLKETGSSLPRKIGDTPNKLLGLLRRAPLFGLEKLGNRADK